MITNGGKTPRTTAPAATIEPLLTCAPPRKVTFEPIQQSSSIVIGCGWIPWVRIGTSVEALEMVARREKIRVLPHDDKISYGNHPARPKETPGIAGAVRPYGKTLANIVHAAPTDDGMGANRYVVANLSHAGINHQDHNAGFQSNSFAEIAHFGILHFHTPAEK